MQHRAPMTPREHFVLRVLAVAVALSAVAGLLVGIASLPDLRAPAPSPAVSLVPPLNLTAPAVGGGRSSRSFARPPLLSWSASTAFSAGVPAEGVIPAATPSAVSPSRPARPTSPSPGVSAVTARHPARPASPAVASRKGKVSAAAGPTDRQWANLRACESGYLGYVANTSNGYYGPYQFDLPTWRSNGGVGRPDLASPSEQDRVARLLFSRRGAQPWPVCGVWLSR